jgi:hypothetical protein
VTIEGVAKNEDVDHFAVEARKGDRMTAEIEGIRLGHGHVRSLRRHPRRQAASSAPHRTTRPCCCRTPSPRSSRPRTGATPVQVRETSFAGSDTSFYRLHVGTFPRPRAVHPAGGAPGETLQVRYLGDVAGALDATLKLPDSEGPFDAFAERDGLPAPSPNTVQVSAGTNAQEAEPNDQREQASACDAAAPLAFHGIIERPGDRDWFRFKAAKGQSLKVDVLARRLRSSLDSTLAIHAADGRRIAENDDADGPDSHLDFRPDADGEYFITVADHLGAGGESFTYRIEIRPATPALSLSIPVFKKDTQDYQAVAVPRGNRFALLLAARREDVGGALDLAVQGLPAGARATVPQIADGVDQVPVLFEATPDAPLTGALVEVQGAKGKAGERAVAGHRCTRSVELVRGNPNNTVYYKTSRGPARAGRDRGGAVQAWSWTQPKLGDPAGGLAAPARDGGAEARVRRTRSR